MRHLQRGKLSVLYVLCTPAQLSVLQWCVPGAILSQLERSGSPASEVSASEVSASKVSASEVSANVAVA